MDGDLVHKECIYEAFQRFDDISWQGNVYECETRSRQHKFSLVRGTSPVTD
ncbi:hypothetical protein KIN20_013921 [Parelaphostrongylus tenuis]|uniref:Uncharacterized protein n=1 Tax=Parelaphostrongylus tenuis TaxID=148309 RepID=A0AAD5QRG0_PARTN|nr:hypothetical protein KIN20_013921 [Parelaphostrongylus tenuis]